MMFDAGILFSTKKVKKRRFHVYEMSNTSRMLKVKKFKQFNHMLIIQIV